MTQNCPQKRTKILPNPFWVTFEGTKDIELFQNA